MKFVNRNGLQSDGLTATITAAAQNLAVDVQDLVHASIYVIQSTDAGTVSLAVEESPDGTTWAQVGALIADTDFAAGAGTALLRFLESTNGMPRITKLVRVRAVALAAGGVYTLKVAGGQRVGVR